MATPITSTLVVNTGQFRRGMDTAISLVGRLSSGVVALTKFLLALGAGFVAVTAGAVAFARSQALLIDRIGKVASVTGFTTQQLQALRFAAEVAGVSSDQLDVALRRFSRRLGEAARGTGELLPALRRLNIAVRDGEGNIRDEFEVLKDFADGIKRTKSETAQLSLAFKAFDSEGAELVQTLVNGRAGLLAFFKMQRILNLEISSQSIENIEMLNDSITALQLAFKKITAEALGALAPALTDVIIEAMFGLKRIIEETEGGMEEFAKTVASKFITAIQGATIGLINFYNILVPIANTAMKLSSSLNLPGTELHNLRKNLQDFKDIEGKGFLDRMTTISVTSGRTAEILEKKLGKGFLLTKENVATAIQTIEQEIKRLEDAGQGEMTLLDPISAETIASITKTFTDLIDAIKEGPTPSEEIEDLKTNAEKAYGPLTKLLMALFGEERVTEFWTEWESTGIGALTRFGAVAKLVLGEQIFENLRAGLESAGVGDFVKTMSEGLVKAATMFEDALAQAFVNGKADFSDLADFIKVTLAKAFIQKTITGPLLALFNLGGRAKGGPVTAGQSYLVGEEGMEIFRPNTSGTIIPNNMINSTSGTPMGGTTNVYYTINATDPESFRSQLSRDPEFIYNLTRVGARRTPA